MTTSDSSCSHTVETPVNSDEYIEIKPSHLTVLRNINPDRPYTPSIKGRINQNPSFIKSTSLVNLTHGDIITIMEKIEKIVINSPEGMKYKLGTLFLDEKYYGPAPGTLRVFANNRACFFTGRGWRKIRLNKKES